MSVPSARSAPARSAIAADLPYAATPSSTSATAAVVVLLAGLAAVVGARWIGTRAGLDALWVGAGFGVALVVLWRVVNGPALAGLRGRSPAGSTAVAVLLGAAFGVALVGVTVAGASIAGAPIVPGIARPAAPLVPWAAITILVATAEEGILRGVLFDRMRAVGGLVPAVVVTTVAFALLHVPLYGWDVIPLDLAVGLGLVGLRLSTRTVLAPIVAHAVADLATWWL